MPHRLPPDLDARLRAALEYGGFVRHVGVELTEVDPDRVGGRLDVGDHHLQPYGLVHGGVYMTMVEMLGSVGAAVWAVTSGVAAGAVGVANSTDFLKGHREGPLAAVATPVHRGRTSQLWQTEIRSEDGGALVARGQVRLHNVGDAVVENRA